MTSTILRVYGKKDLLLKACQITKTTFSAKQYLITLNSFEQFKANKTYKGVCRFYCFPVYP